LRRPGRGPLPWPRVDPVARSAGVRGALAAVFGGLFRTERWAGTDVTRWSW
jgi:hypothetical protein